MSLYAEKPIQPFPLSGHESSNLAALNTTLLHIFLSAKNGKKLDKNFDTSFERQPQHVLFQENFFSHFLLLIFNR